MRDQKKFKEFPLSSWAVDNRTTVFVMVAILVFLGLRTYQQLPKELFPDVTLPTIYVSTFYPGASPHDIENLITKPLEKQIGALSGINRIVSNSVQDFSGIQIEFNSEVAIDDANQRVRDAVDKAKPDLPTDLDPSLGPNVSKLEFSDFPIMQIHISGDYEPIFLKKYADLIRERVEQLPQVTRVDMVGAPEREIQINVDMYRAQAAQITLFDIYNAISNENRIVSGGTVRIGNMRHTISISGEFENPEQLASLVINNMHNQPIYLRDVAEVVDGLKEQESFARFNQQQVISLNVVKKSGANLIETSDQIHALIDDLSDRVIPAGIDVSITGDTSSFTRTQIKELINTIIIGFILVTLLLMFFMGVTDALFVALAVPLSVFLAFIVLAAMGWSLNVIVMFAFLLGLGIVVDDAIVVIENTHRHFANGRVPIHLAAKHAAGEVFAPVLSGTLTTLAPFLPLLFWPGVVGSFMLGLPLTLLLTLTASLIVAYLFNPVFAATFMKSASEQTKLNPKKRLLATAIAVAMGVALSVSGARLPGHIILFMVAFYWLYVWVLERAVHRFQSIGWPRIQQSYVRMVEWTLRNPIKLFLAIVLTFVFSVVLIIWRQPGVEQFPSGDPNVINTYIVMPIGTDQAVTDSITRLVEQRIWEVVGKENPIVRSVLSSVAIGAAEDPFEQNISSHKGKVTVHFIDPQQRRHRKSEVYMEKIRQAVRDIEGATITVGVQQAGPPQGKPVNIKIIGEDFESLIAAAVGVKKYLDSLAIEGVEELKMDLQPIKPEAVVTLDRERMNRLGITTKQAGFAIRNAVYGWEASRLRVGNDDFPIVIRFEESQRTDLEKLKDLIISYRDQTNGQIRQIPLSAFAHIEYKDTYSGIKREDQKRVITLESNLLSGYENRQPMIMGQIRKALEAYPLPNNVQIGFAGASQEMQETISFLSFAWLISLLLIIMIMVAQFNSVSKPFIIFVEVFFSIIGVLLGYGLTGMTITVVMTGVGVIALLGIVVRNGILLIEFTDKLIEQGMPVRQAVVEAARIRMTPVALTAIAAILGMIPLAIGLNIDFYGLITALKPDIWFGGENVVFWGPLAWTIIFGLSFATFVTLLVVPVMYLLNEQLKDWLNQKTGWPRKQVTSVAADIALEAVADGRS